MRSQIKRLAVCSTIYIFIWIVGEHQTRAQQTYGKITGVRLAGKPDKIDSRAKFKLEALGEQLTGLTTDTPVSLLDETGRSAVESAKIVSIADTVVTIEAEGTMPIAISQVKLGDLAETGDFLVTVQAEAKPKPPQIKNIEIKFEMMRSLRYPEEYSLFVSKEDGEGEFSKDPNHMRVEMVPPGFSDVRIRPGSNNKFLVIDFRAPEKYEVKNVVITVYSSGNLDERNIVAVAEPFKEKSAPVDPNQPVISDAEILFIQRNRGYGRVKIEGRGFGNYPRSPFGSEKACCRRHSDQVKLESSGSNGETSRELKTFVSEGRLSLLSLPPEERNRRSRLLDRLYRIGDELERSREDWQDWQNEIQKRLRVELMPRNPDLRVDKIEIVYIDDKLIDLYFEFSKYNDISQPFRLSRVTLTVKKDGAKTIQTVPGPEIKAAVKGPETYIAWQEVGAKRDRNLQYRYTILAPDSANALFGKGVSANFYVIQLSVINNGSKKVAIPLAAIQAEVEWLSKDYEPGNSSSEGGRHTGADLQKPQDNKPKNGNGSCFQGEKECEKGFLYYQGPPTLPPIPLQAVSGYFEVFRRARGKRAVTFNILNGVGQFATGFFPLFGPGYPMGVSIFSNTFVPALRTAVGDLTSQQLQNLTGLSWESVEVLPSGGGSVNKFIYIQRDDQDFRLAKEDKQERNNGNGLRPPAKKRIINILGLEVNGYEVADSEAKQATQQ
ncbi:MAG TPA: hypothetical protein VJZ77_04090 [Blastocatellia bacterium]|nr:hypothetical protein [Blastocatellia bacterium]